MEDVLRRMRDLVVRLERRGGFYIQPFTYQSLVSFISGYDLAIVEAGNASQLDQFELWLHQKVGHHCSLHWSTVVCNLFAQGDEVQAIHVFCRLFQDFVNGKDAVTGSSGAANT